MSSNVFSTRLQFLQAANSFYPITIAESFTLFRQFFLGLPIYIPAPRSYTNTVEWPGCLWAHQQCSLLPVRTRAIGGTTLERSPPSFISLSNFYSTRNIYRSKMSLVLELVPQRIVQWVPIPGRVALLVTETHVTFGSYAWNNSTIVLWLYLRL